MSEIRRKYDLEFREGAVRFIRETHKPITVVAGDLGINSETLGNWCKRDRIERGESDRLTIDERARLAFRTPPNRPTRPDPIHRIWRYLR